MEHRIITIGREFGAGGREVGKKLAEKLNIPYYDKEIIEMAAMKSGLSTEYIQNNDEVATNSFLYSLVMGTRTLSGQKTVDEIRMDAEREVIREIAEKGSCVIIGRAADDVLKGKNLLRVFLSAEEADRAERVSKRDQISQEQAVKKVRKMDKLRAVYYSEYADAHWGSARNYDLCMNLSYINMDKAVEMIAMNY